jgi:hypothetical protein
LDTAFNTKVTVIYHAPTSVVGISQERIAVRRELDENHSRGADKIS